MHGGACLLPNCLQHATASSAGRLLVLIPALALSSCCQLLNASHCHATELLQAGQAELMCFIRSFEVLECPIGAVAYLLMHQYTIRLCTVPDISTPEGMQAL